MDRFVDALVEEIRRKGENMAGQALETLYLGGGSPSLLSKVQLEKILNAIQSYHSFQENPEWTIELNPDDINRESIQNLFQAGFNRLSIGIQSFYDRDLNLMRRSHNSDQAEAAVELAGSAGFKNISIDLIYGLPGQSQGEWAQNIDRALTLPISHLSAYHLTFEPGTIFDHWRKKGKLLPVPEEESVKQYRVLREKLLSAGFDHYEISNFSQGGAVSRHNMLYWSGVPYMGLGPSAHSFNGKQRSWNPSSLKQYMEGVELGDEIGEVEQLTDRERYHDYLISSLRTSRGADPAHVEKAHGTDYRSHLESEARTFLKDGSMSIESGRLVISPKKWLITDHILRALFVD